MYMSENIMVGVGLCRSIGQPVLELMISCLGLLSVQITDTHHDIWPGITLSYQSESFPTSGTISFISYSLETELVDGCV